ncbi:RAD50-interacting protein 1 [Nematolebias whitei]|uniref:RAD50-interacting protein 1 n=1 Tax=Nematolebias whitei TaxID=451745 RepID=UPI00189A2332|nr:RAD50-interacting protein 1 [Nematolebias whitei]
MAAIISALEDAAVDEAELGESRRFSGGFQNRQEFGLDLLDKEFGSELRSAQTVSQLLDRVRHETSELEEQVLTVSSSVPPKVSWCLSEAEEVGCSLEELLQRQRGVSSSLHEHLQGTKLWMDGLDETFNRVDFMDKSLRYLKCLHYMGELSATVQQCLMINSVGDAIRAVKNMAALDCGLNQSGCSHLQDFLRKTLSFWHNIIKEQLTSDFENVLTHLHWPIVSTCQPSTPVANSQEVSSRLEEVVTQLHALQTSDNLVSQRGQSLSSDQVLSSATPQLQDPPLCLPVQIMLQPLRKRFRYHFCGNRQTNSLSKPEWYLTQVLIWMGSSSDFLNEKIQPVLDQAGAAVSARPSDLVDNLCLFLDFAFASPYRSVSLLKCPVTTRKISVSSDQRYQALPSSSAQLKFLELQRELVDDFRIRLTQVMKEESRFPLGVRYCAILNAVNYISTILRDWGDNVFFLQLQQAAVSLGEQEVVGGLEMMEVGRLASLEGSLFDGLLSLLDRLKGDMLGRLLDFLMRDIAEKAKPYCHERWLSAPSQQDQLTSSLSSSACPMMLCVRDRLLNLHQALSLPLFQLTWQGLAERLDSFLYREVILANHFSDSGAAQLHFDMSRNLFPLFGHYCRRPENFFKHVKEACIVLCLNVGSAILLKNLLKRSTQEPGDQDRAGESSPESALNEMGVYCLAPCDVMILINLRASLPQI